MQGWKRLAVVSLMAGAGAIIGGNAMSQPPPFVIEAADRGPALMSNFRFTKTVDRGFPIDALRFDVKIGRVGGQCRSVVIYYSIISKSGAYMLKRTWHQQISNVATGEIHTGQIGDFTTEWPEVGKVQVWTECSPM